MKQRTTTNALGTAQPGRMGMVAIVYIVVGMIAGAFLLRDGGGLVVGGALGYLIFAYGRLSARVQRLETALGRQTVQPVDAQAPPATPPTDSPPETVGESAEPSPDLDLDLPSSGEWLTEPVPSVRVVPVPDQPSDTAWNEGETARPPSLMSEQIIVWARDFLFGGNLVVRLGILVLVIGLAFLLKYAAEHARLPIELRLAGVAVAGMALLFVGWRTRGAKPGFSMALQGGGVAVIYLTAFAATRLYGVLPPGLAFGVMLGVVVASALLAVLQDSRTLSIIGIAGGFIAPILVSTGTGSHVMLFSFYSILNVGILIVAWCKSWRILNLLGFAFTFVIGGYWGFQYYQPAHFATVEPFLVAHFLFYVAIAVLYAMRQPLDLRGYVDGTLVFGTPLVVAGLQSALVHDREYGMAFSALAIAAFYLLLARGLWLRVAESLRNLCESFLALGVAFGTMAIPLAFEGRITAAAWALEGAALVWIGLRQERLLARIAGLALQVGAALFFLSDYRQPQEVYAFLNSTYLGFVLLTLAALFIGFQYLRFASPAFWEVPIPFVAMGWALLWWLAGGAHEIVDRIPSQYQLDAGLVYLVATVLWLTGTARHLDWRAAGLAAQGYLPMIVAAGLLAKLGADYPHPTVHWGALLWPLTLATHLYSLRRLEKTWSHSIVSGWHAAGFVLATLLVTWEIVWRAQHTLQVSQTWGIALWGYVPMLMLWFADRFGSRFVWPFQVHERAYRTFGMGVLVAGILLWGGMLTLLEGNPAPLPYVPLFNPLALGQLLALAVAIRWLLRVPQRSLFPACLRLGLMPLGLWLVLTTAVARSVHFWDGVPYRGDALFASQVFQTTIAILWTTLALTAMVYATRRAWREAWLVGAVLLGVVVIKLFIVDLSGIGSVERIVSFVTVGLLMLAIGYFSPLPPRQAEEDRA